MGCQDVKKNAIYVALDGKMYVLRCKLGIASNMKVPRKYKSINFLLHGLLKIWPDFITFLAMTFRAENREWIDKGWDRKRIGN